MTLMPIIHLSLIIAEVIIGIIALRKVMPMGNKDDYDNVKNVKVRLIFFCILMVLIILELIPRLILKKSIKFKIFTIILLGISVVRNLYVLNKRIREESTNK